MPCNPSVGGLAKSHLVFEIDALGGETGLNADMTALQEKTLNTSKGPAVRATRAQCDKLRYAARMRATVLSTQNLTVLEDLVTGISVQNGTCRGVETAKNGRICGKTTVLATGTALHGRIWIGKECAESGGDGRAAADALARNIAELGFRMVRLKTGTPPRILANSIDFAKTEARYGNKETQCFSMRTEHIDKTKENCSTWNNPAATAQGSCRKLFHVEQFDALREYASQIGRAHV